MLTFDQTDLCAAFNVCTRSASLWCSGLPFTREGRSKRYNVADFLPSLPGKHAASVPGLIALCRTDDNPVVADVGDIDRACALGGWLDLHMPEAGARLYNVRQAFFGGLALGFRSSALMGETEYLRTILPRHGGILAFLITADAATLPRDWVQWSREFAVVHVGLERVTVTAAQLEDLPIVRMATFTDLGLDEKAMDEVRRLVPDQVRNRDLKAALADGSSETHRTIAAMSPARRLSLGRELEAQKQAVEAAKPKRQMTAEEEAQALIMLRGISHPATRLAASREIGLA